MGTRERTVYSERGAMKEEKRKMGRGKTSVVAGFRQR